MALRLLQEYQSDGEEEAEEAGAEAKAGPSRERAVIKTEKMDGMVLKNNMINASRHGPVEVEGAVKSEKAEKVEKVEKSDEDIFMDFVFKNCQEGHDGEEGESSSDTGESSEDESADSSTDEDNKEWGTITGGEDSDSDANQVKIMPNNNKKNNIKAKGELALEDLPPIEDLQISVPEQECEAIGTVHDVVDQLVIVESFPNNPSLDLDTVLFLDGGKTALGQVFDVFGQVTKPFYCVRFNSATHIKDKGIVFGMLVYYAPKTVHTHYVFISELMKTRGSDASWKDDVEPPAQYVEYSDDEEERKAKRLLKNNRKNNADAAEGEDPSRNPQNSHRPTEFEEIMNRRNIMKTAECNRNSQNNPRHRMEGFNPFGRRGNPSARLNSEPSSEIRWPSNASRYTRNAPGRHPTPMPRNWSRNAQSSPMPSMFMRPPFMRPPRFAVTPVDWTGGQMNPYVMAPPPVNAPPPPPSWSPFHPSSSPFHPSSAPPGTQ